MSAGLATLRQLEDGRAYMQLDELGVLLEREIAAVPGVHLQREGSLFWLHLSPQGEKIRSLAALTARKGRAFGPVFHHLLSQGIYLAPSAFEVGFLSTAHTAADVTTLAGALRTALAETPP
jgi:glutamate-1-semialdehyde 2,1-aminomutase